jgi:hypothetical protein
MYLTLHWEDSREIDEGGQIGVRFDTVPDIPTQAMVDACKPAVQTFWQSAGAAIPSSYRLRYLRLAGIGTDGKYLPGSFSFDATYGAGISTANAAVVFPMQVASVATLLTELPRGQASRGRVYLPPIAASLDAQGRWSAAQCNARADEVAKMLTSLNAVIKEPAGLPAIASVFSKGTTKNAGGLRSFVTGVKVGTRPDVQRRRAKGQAEIYGNTYAVAH